MSGFTPEMNPPCAIAAPATASSAWPIRLARGHGNGRPVRPSPAQAGPIDQVGDDEDAALVLAEVADLQQARMRHLQRARFEQEARADGVPVRLLFALQDADGDRNAERPVRAL